MKSSFTKIGFLIAVLARCFSAAAAENGAQEKYAQALAAYDQRPSSGMNDRAIELLEAARGEAQEVLTKYDINILLSRAYNFKAHHLPTDKLRIPIHELGMTAAQDAMDSNDRLAEAPYFYGVNLGRWALARGILESLSRKGELIETLNETTRLPTRSGQPGETLDGYGPARALGRLYFKLPGFAGGSNERAREYQEKAFAKAPEYAENIVFLAETLNALGGAENKVRARQLLDQLLAQDPERYNERRLVETRDAFAEGLELRKKIGN